MSANHSAIGDALFTKTQQRVLGLLYGRPEQSFYSNEIVRLAGMGKGTVTRELDKLSAAGLLTLSRRGNQKHYQANPDNPIFSELTAITQKTFGVVDILKTALQSILPKAELAFVYGSVAKGTEHAGSDIDLMLVGEGLSFSGVMALLLTAEEMSGRKINPTLYSPEELKDRINKQQSFISRVLEQDKLWLSGEDIFVRKYRELIT